MMDLKGITLNGVPLTIQELFRFQKTDPEIKELLKAGRMRGQLYHSPAKPKLRTYRERNGEPMSLSLSKLHEENLHNHFRQDKRVRSQIVALLLAGKTISVNTVPKMIQQVTKDSDELPSHAIRAHINMLNRSPLLNYIIKEREDQLHTPYKAWSYSMSEETRDHLSFNDALKLAYQMNPIKKQGEESQTVKEPPETESEKNQAPTGIEFQFTNEEGTPTIRIRGEFHFYFHMGIGR